MPLTFKRQPDGSFIISDGTASYAVPFGIEVSRDKHDSFADAVRDIVNQHRPYDLIGLSVHDGRAYKVMTTRRRNTLYVTLVDRKPMGWMEFDLDGHKLVESLAAIAPSHQRRGIYTALLRYLNKPEFPVVLSNDYMSVSNTLRWMKKEAYSAQHGRYKVNPRPPKRAIRAAVIALLNRAHTR